jgi:hypothetical protein
MIPAGSRYEDAEHQFTLAHLYSEWGFPLVESDEGTVDMRIRVTSRDTLYRVTTISPPDTQPYQAPFEYYAKEDEDWQFLAYKFTGDARRWWELADANQTVWYPLDLKMGDYIRIPA